MAQSEEKAKVRQMIVGGLGRPFALGMLYNAPNDELIPGMALLNAETLQSLTVSRPQRSSHFDVSASDSTKDTTFNLNVDASLKLSFMSGLIEVGGSANYLKNTKESKNQCRVTLQYQATTHFEQLLLTAEVCDQLQSSPIISKGLATHVVTGIEYGANAFFVFESQKVKTSDLQTVKGQMEVTIKKIPTAEISGEAKVDLTEEEIKNVKTFSVKFYGDFLLEKNPATFDAAVQTYVDLPGLLIGVEGKDPVNTVPVKVWLLPLEVFTLQPGPVTKGISGGLVFEAEQTLEELDSITMRCNDCLSVSAVGKFPQLQEKLHKFYKLCHYYSVELQRQMAETCPAIREGTQAEDVLRRLFEQRQASPFSQDKLSQWLQDKEREVNVVQSCLDIMKGVTVLSTQAEVDEVVLAPGDKERLGFIFTSLGTRDAQLEDMGNFLNSLRVGKVYEEKKSASAEKLWFYSDYFMKLMRNKAEWYKTRAHFITAITDTKYHGYAVYKYRNGIKEGSWERAVGEGDEEEEVAASE